MSEYVLVTDWERYEDGFYLSNEWLKENLGMNEEEITEIIKKQKNNCLYMAYIVKAVNYCIYSQMDSDLVLIDDEMNVLVRCESYVIGNNHEKRIEYDF